jgi:hypothetical protein
MRPLWHESGSTKRGGFIESRVSFAQSVQEFILTGSLIYVGNSIYKSPNAMGTKEIEILLDLIEDDYLQRTYYQRAVQRIRYDRAIPELGWDSTRRHTETFRIAFRNMLSPPTERTLCRQTS